MAELQIDPEAINRYVADQIIESAIGEKLKEAIDNEIKTLTQGYNNPLKHVVTLAVQQAAREYLDTPEVKDRLAEIVKERLTDQVLAELVSKISVTSF